MVEDRSGKFTEIHLEQHILTPGGVQVTSVGLGWGAGGGSHGHFCGLYAKTCDFITEPSEPMYRLGLLWDCAKVRGSLELRCVCKYE